MENKDEEIKSVDELIENVAGMTKDEYESIRDKAHEEAKNTRHEWRMRGRGKLYCTSCVLPHSSYVPMNKILVGIDEQGLPIFTTLQ
jgi:ElaB/YqjD/DUF883 family membrane-anchored ribosome-binding protein